MFFFFFFSSRRRHTRCSRDWSSDVCSSDLLRVIRRANAPKGDVLGVARTAGILAAKRTPQLIPLCHPLRITGVDVTFSDDLRRGELAVEARVRTVDKTGVEMEALTAVSVAAL